MYRGIRGAVEATVNVGIIKTVLLTYFTRAGLKNIYILALIAKWICMQCYAHNYF
jgi:hypothetical protein